MAIKVIKRNTTVKPVGVVKQDAFSADAELYKSISEASTKLMVQSYRDGINEATERGKETARLTVLDTTGAIKKVDAPESFGKIATESFNKAMISRYETSIDSQLKNMLSSIQLKSSDGKTLYDDVTQGIPLYNNPDLYKKHAVRKIAEIIKQTPDDLQAYTQQRGEQLLSTGLTQVSKNQHDQNVKTIQYQTNRDLNRQVSESSSLFSDGKTNLDTKLEEYRKLRENINDQAQLLKPNDFNNLINNVDSELIKGVINSIVKEGNNGNGLYKHEIAKFQDLYEKNGKIPYENYNKVIKAVKPSILIDDNIRAHFNVLKNNAVVLGKPTNRGSQARADQTSNQLETLANESNIPMTTLIATSQDAQDQIQQDGILPTSLTNTFDSYLTVDGYDPTGVKGYELFTIWDNLTLVNKGNLVGQVRNTELFEKEINNFMMAMSRRMDINKSPEGFQQGLTTYNFTKENGSEFNNLLRAELNKYKKDKEYSGSAESGELRDELIDRFISGGFFKGDRDRSWRPMHSGRKMTVEQGEEYIDEAIIAFALSLKTASGDGKKRPTMSLNESLTKTWLQLRDDFAYQKGLFTAEGLAAFQNYSYNVPNPDAGKVVGYMGMSSVSPENFRRTHNMGASVKTAYTLERAFSGESYANVNPINEFYKFVEDVSDSILNPKSKELKSTFGEDVFIQLRMNSTKQNPSYQLLYKDKITGNVVPVIANEAPVIINLNDFKISLKEDIEIMKRIGGSYKEVGNKIWQEWQDSLEEHKKLRLAGGFLSDSLISKPTLESTIENQTSMEFQDLNDEGSWFDDTVENLKKVPDYLSRLLGIDKAGATTIGNSIESIQRFNPTNIRFSADNQWVGSMGNENGFEVFEANEHGYHATLKILNTYNEKYYDNKMTITDMITRWAPPKENNTKAYINYISKSSEYPDDEIIDMMDEDLLFNILNAMTKMELGLSVYNQYDDWENEIRNGISMALN